MSEGHGEPPADGPLEQSARPDEQALAATEQNQTRADAPPLAQTELAGLSGVNRATRPASDDPGYVSAKPHLATGDFGAHVAELAHLLADNGYPNDVAEGRAQPILTDDLMRMVRAFQEEHDIDPSKPQDGAAPIVRRDHEGIVTAETWAALHGINGIDREQAAEKGLAVTTRYPAGSFA